MSNNNEETIGLGNLGNVNNSSYTNAKPTTFIEKNKYTKLMNGLRKIERLNLEKLRELKELLNNRNEIIANHEKNGNNNSPKISYNYNQKIKEVENKIKEREKEKQLNELREGLEKSKNTAYLKSFGKAFGKYVPSSLKSAKKVFSRESYNSTLDRVNQEYISKRIKELKNESVPEINKINIENIKKYINKIERNNDIKKILSFTNSISINSCSDNISEKYKSLNNFNIDIAKNIEKILLNIKRYKKLEDKNKRLNESLVNELNNIHWKRSHNEEYYLIEKGIKSKESLKISMNNNKNKIERSEKFADNYIKQIFINLELILLIKKDIINRLLYIKKLHKLEGEVIINNYLTIVNDNYNETKKNTDDIINKYKSINIKKGVKEKKIGESSNETQYFLTKMSEKKCKNNSSSINRRTSNTSSVTTNNTKKTNNSSSATSSNSSGNAKKSNNSVKPSILGRIGARLSFGKKQ